MCVTCGCSADENGVKILHVHPAHNHTHDHDHTHEHGHHHHHHTHEHGHNHSHSHDHHHHPEKTVLELERDILQKNDISAARNRGYLEAKNIFALNLVSSPGSGKTTLLETTLKALHDELSCYVIEGDQQTTQDAQRIAETGAPVLQINTGKGCHLDADMVQKAIRELNPKNDSVLFIENVGNLVCPAMFDLGESERIVIMSITEGEDKPIKYPDMFQSAQVCLINKMDLLPYLNFDLEKAKEYALQVNPNLQFIEVSATTSEGMSQWYDWLKNKVQEATTGL